MSAVGFALEGNPGLNEHRARDFAQLLALGNNITALELASEILQQAGLNPDRPPTSHDIELDHDRLEQMAAVFAEVPELLTNADQYAYLSAAVVKALEQ